jgi:Na+/proline symporter
VITNILLIPARIRAGRRARSTSDRDIKRWLIKGVAAWMLFGLALTALGWEGTPITPSTPNDQSLTMENMNR